MSDGDLLVRFAGGDADALQELVRRYEKPLYAYLVRFTGSRTFAEDAFQEAFLRVVQEAGRYDRSRAFKPWLYSIATRLAIDGHRKRSVRREVPLEGSGGGEEGGILSALEDPEPNPGAQAETGEETERLYAALARLTDVERVVALMHFREGLTLPEISEALEVPLGTVKSRLHAGLQRLGKLMNLRADGWRRAEGGGTPGKS